MFIVHLKCVQKVLIIFLLEDKNTFNESVSVVIVTYNREIQLKKAIESVLVQKDIEFEILVIDNNSKDNTEEYIKNLQKKHSNIVYKKLDRNYGCVIARNRGMEFAQKDFIFHLDDDAFLEDDLFLYKGINKLKALPKEVGLMAVGVKEIAIQKITNKPPRHHKYQDCYTLYFSGSAAFLKKEVYVKIGNMEENFIRQGEELEYALRMLRRNYYVVFTDKLFITHCPLHKNTENLNTFTFYYLLKNNLFTYEKYFSGLNKFLLKWGLKAILLFRTRLKKDSLQKYFDALNENKKMLLSLQENTLTKSKQKIALYLLKNSPKSIASKTNYSIFRYYLDFILQK